MKSFVSVLLRSIFSLTLIAPLGCNPANDLNEREHLAVLSYLEVISQDDLGERGEDNITFCLAEDSETKILVDPDQEIITRVGASKADVVGLSECNVEWLIRTRGVRKDLESLDVLLWIREIAISGEDATVTIVRSWRYGDREQLFCDLARTPNGWSAVSLREGWIE